MTLDDQLQRLAPLTIGTVAKLAGIKPNSAAVKRIRGSTFSGAQLRAIAKGLDRIADAADNMAKERT